MRPCPSRPLGWAKANRLKDDSNDKIRHFRNQHPSMPFLHLLQWRSARRRPFQWTRLSIQVTLFFLLGHTSMAQSLTTDPALDAIKKALQTGQLDQAQKLVSQARETAPQNVQWQFMEGVIQAQQGQTDKAIDTFRKLTESHPELSEAYNNLGVLYAAKGRLEESRAYLEKALQTHPSYAAAHRNLSDVLSQLAKDSYGKALQVEPKARLSTPQLTLLGSIAPEKRLQMAGANPGPSVAAPSVSRPTGPAQAPAAAASSKPPNAATATAPVTSAPSAPVTASGNTSVSASSKTLLAAPPKPATPPPAASPVSSAAQVTAAATTPATQAAPPPTAAIQSTPTSSTASSTVQAPAPASGPAAKSTPAQTASKQTSTNKADQDAVKSAVIAWARAWSNKDMSRYFAAYAPHYTMANMSRAKWEADRQLKILSKKTISVSLNQLQINVTGDKATARFQQIYTSDHFQGNSRKTLELQRQGERWVITRESVN